MTTPAEDVADPEDPEGGSVTVPLVLEPGRTRRTFAEVHATWAFNTHREDIFTEFERYLAMVRKVISVKACWISGTFISDKDQPSDIDVVFLVAQDDVNALRSSGHSFVTPGGLDALSKRRNLRVDAFLLPWRIRPSVKTTSADNEYLQSRGYWDDFWLRKRSVPKGDPPTPLCALPRRGYVEVIVDDFA